MNMPIPNAALEGAPSIVHYVKGETATGAERSFGSSENGFTAPKLDLDGLVWPRSAPLPAAAIPVAEIMDVLVATGEALTRDADGLLAQALERSARTNPLPRDILERAYAGIGGSFTRQRMQFQIDQELGGADVLDGWREVTTPGGRRCAYRACPPRMIHIIAGNAPGVAAGTIIRASLTKGVSLIKLPSNDLFTATAILRTMAAVAPGHPLTKCFTAAYWKGGDQAVEGSVFQPQYFDKLIAWGGESTIRNAMKNLGPGLELVSFDPKSSISLVGREAFASAEALAEAADYAAMDATVFDQQACSSSRFQFVEGDEADVDRYCALLEAALKKPRATASAVRRPLPVDLRDEIDSLREMPDFYGVWGESDGGGLVIRSDDPVDFYPDHKVVNVVPVKRLEDAVRHVNIATQTVGIYPESRKRALRDAVANAGAQRVVSLGAAVNIEHGLPHDGFRPLQRFVRWVNDEVRGEVVAPIDG